MNRIAQWNLKEASKLKRSIWRGTKKETIELEMTIEEAIRFTISGGVITPETILNNSPKNVLPYEGNENKQQQNIRSIKKEDG